MNARFVVAFVVVLLLTAPVDAARRRRPPRPPERSPVERTLALRDGLRQLESGEVVAALDSLRKALGLPVDDLTQVLLGRSLLAANRAKDAVAPLDTVRKDARSPWRTIATRLHAEALVAARQMRRAADALDELLERFPAMPNQPPARMALATCWQTLGRSQAEADVLQTIVWRFPDAAEAAAAATRLAELRKKGVRPASPSFDDYLTRATLWVRDRRYALAEADLAAAEALVGHNAGRRAAVARGRVALWMRAERWSDVIAALGPLAKAPESDRANARTLATALRRAGRVDEGLAILAALGPKATRRDPHPGNARLAEALLEEGRVAEADREYRKLHKTGPGGVARSWTLAWLDYRLGRTDLAVKGFEAVAKKGQAVRCRYWQGRALMDAGRFAEAAEYFRRVAERAPLHYYAYLARSRLFDMGMADPEYAAEKERLTAAAAAEGARIAWPTSGIAAVEPPPAPPPGTLDLLAATYGETLPRLARAALLMGLERRHEARRELRLMLAEIEAVRANRRNVRKLVGRTFSGYLDRRRTPAGPWGENLDALQPKLSRQDRERERKRLLGILRLPREAFADLREAFRSVDDPWGVRKMTMRLEGGWRTVPTADNRDYYRNALPLAWRDAVLAETRARALDPAFVWAVMTVESAFNETAHSVSDARGLLQLLPRTAWLVARELGEPPPDPEELLDPALNVRYGVHYLARLLARFQGQEAFAAVSYNAGPHNVAWRVARQGNAPFDVVMEELPAGGGREYGKRVLEYVAFYQRVYLDDSVLYVPQRVLPPVDGIAY